MAMYPAADVPVVQLSMPGLDPTALLELGSKLGALRDEGVLVLGSGSMTHSFTAFRDRQLIPHMDAFDAWAADALHRGDVDTLTNYLREAPSATLAHPRADHYVPLLLTLGAAGDPGTARTVFNRSFFGNHMRSIQVD